jgi:hypothetical protein
LRLGFFGDFFEEAIMTKTFEIGLTMAGAISAGAYTAGVMDFLFEALDAYYVAKKQPGWDGPTHDVRISIMSGASAGGMTSAICALHAFHDAFDHVWPADPARATPQRRRNRLYSSWVEDIDIRRLLETSDIDNAADGEPARSLLCCDVIDQIVKEAFDLDGVPYSFEIYGADDPRRYGMLNHGEFIDFKIGIDPTPEDGVYALDIRKTQTPEWELFRTAAKATGAFPIGLAPRRLERKPLEYHYASRVGYDGPNGYKVIPPDKWLDEPAQNPYKFVTVDGGTIDNEPLEMTRRYLSGGPDISNASDGFKTDRAVILIAPFPNYLEATVKDAAATELNKDLGLMNISTSLFSALISQARFKPDELARAANDAYYSRYLVAPTRDDIGTPESKKYPIACGVMGGFGGFLHRSFRRHDYLLGRRNAQAFLRWHFNLPENADLFEGFAGDREKWLVREPNSAEAKMLPTQGRGDVRGIPIIPLTTALSKEIVISSDDYPDPEQLFRPDRRADLQRLIQTRADKVVGRLVDVDLPVGDRWLGWLERLGAKRVGTAFAFKKATDLVDHAVDDVRKAFFPLR